MSLQDWRAPPPGPDASSYDPSATGQFAAVQSGLSWLRDIKSMFFVVLFLVAIGGAIYEWITWPQQNHQTSNGSKNAPKPYPLYPWCPPERDECWR
jgi:hypothetical protein